MAQPEAFPGSEVEIPIQLDSAHQTRPRSDSRVFGRANSLQVSQSNGNGQSNGFSMDEKPLTNGSGLHTPQRKVPTREQFVHIIILTSFNETFDKKTLVVPHHPEVLKLGRPNSSGMAPSMYNGFFDSRVISRTHAELYLKDGSVFLRDCGSSNGTFVNGERINERELKEGDTVDLGVDIDAEKNKHQLHRKVSCSVENILTVPIDGTTDIEKVLVDMARINGDEQPNGKTTKKRKGKKGQVTIEDDQEQLSPFDAAMFGDVTRDLEDVTLGINHDFLSGIFVNNNIGTSSNLVHSIRMLINQLHQEKLNNMKLDSVVQFLEKYKAEVDRPGVSKAKEFKNELEKYKGHNNRYKERILELETQLETHRVLLDETNDSNRDLKEQMNTLYQTVTEEQKTNREYVRVISELETELKERNSSIGELQSLLDASENETSEKDTLIRELQSQLMEKDAEIQMMLEEREDYIKKTQRTSVQSDMVLMAAITGVVVALGAYALK